MTERQITWIFRCLGFFVGGALALIVLWSIQDGMW